jgi:hypothetical protein
MVTEAIDLARRGYKASGRSMGPGEATSSMAHASGEAAVSLFRSLFVCAYGRRLVAVPARFCVLGRACCDTLSLLHTTNTGARDQQGMTGLHHRYRRNAILRKTIWHSNKHVDKKKDGLLTITTHHTANPSCNSTKSPQLRQHLSAPSALEFVLIASTGSVAVSVSCK